MADGSDVVVVGGGVIGAACARELAERGVQVTLIERAELAGAASGRNLGLWSTPYDPMLVPMARAGLQSYLAIVDDAPLPVFLDREAIGILSTIGEEEKEAAQVDRDAAAAVGVTSEHLDPQQLRRLEPELRPDLAGAWLLHDGHRLDPAALTVALALRAKELGAVIRHHLSVRALLRQGDRVAGVATDEGTVEAGTVVLAAGPWSQDLLRTLDLRIPITGARGWLVRLRPPRTLISHWIEGAARSLFRASVGEVAAGAFAEGVPEPDVGTMLQPAPDGSIVAGASRQAVVTNEPDDAGVPHAIVRGAISMLPALAEAAVVSAWWGVRPMSPDERPLVGRLAEGLIVATGHGSEGVILAAGTGQLVAAAITGDEPPFNPAPFDPGRFA